MLSSQSEEIQHHSSPLLLLKIIQHLQKKGSITVKDVRLLNLRNVSLNKEEQLQKIKTKESIDVLLQCEQ